MENNTAVDENMDEFPPIKLVRLILYILIFVVGLIGNLLVMIVVRARGKRRIFHDYFLLNLAIADLLYILCLPADIYIEMARFPFTEVYCKLIYPLTTFAFSLSILTLTSMAVGRCYIMQGNVRHPIKDRTTFLCIASLWILSLLCVLPLSITARSAPNTCLEDWPSSTHRRAYTIVLLVLQYIAPLVIIGIAYVYIGFLLINKKQPRLKVNMASHKLMVNIKQRNLQIIRTLAVIVVLFALLMLPHEIAWMLMDFGKENHIEIGEVLIKYSPILTYLHSCSNPLVYGLMISQFRNDIKKCLCCLELDDERGSSRMSPTASGKVENEQLAPSNRKKVSLFGKKNTFKKPLIAEIGNDKEGCTTKVKGKDGRKQENQLL